MTILERLLLKRGATPESLPSNTKVGKLVRSRGCYPGPEYHRIRALPRRKWEEDSELDELVALMTRWLRTENGTQTLRPMQAVVLKELYDYGFSVCVANMGDGKTICTALAPTVLDSKRPLFFTYAKLLDKTRREFLALSEHWKVCRNYEFFNYEKLGLVKNDTFLDRFEPDFVCADESHAFRRKSSGRTKRMTRYFEKHPNTIFLPLTGTPGEASIRDPAHIVGWSMKEHSPYPRTHNEIELWGQALDVNVDEFQRLHGGCLFSLEEEGRKEGTIEEARALVGRRIEQTPGFVTKRTASVACSLYLQALVFNDYSAHMEGLFEGVREKTCSPDGKEFREAVVLGTVLKWMSCGFWYLIDPDPPLAWREARRDWGAFCRDDLAHNRSHRDTPLQVALACSRGEIDGTYFHRWKEIEPTFKPTHVTQWLDLAPIHKMIEWLDEEQGILFTPYRAVGEKISELTGLPYFANQGVCGRTGLNIETYPAGPCVASVEANKLGRNLQRWHKELIVGGISSSADLEQTIGRVHRPGQTADECEITFFWGCRENAETLYKARRRAEFDRDVGRNSASKLLTCDWLVPDEDELTSWSGSRWAND